MAMIGITERVLEIFAKFGLFNVHRECFKRMKNVSELCEKIALAARFTEESSKANADIFPIALLCANQYGNCGQRL